MFSVGSTRLTETDATGAGGGVVTVTATVELRPSTSAEIVALPAATPATRPVDETVATAAAELDQLTARSASTAPVESRTVAVSCAVLPTTTDAVVGEILSDAAGTEVTETGADVVRPSADAVMVVVPTVTPLNIPAEVTGAIAVLPLDQLTA